MMMLETSSREKAVVVGLVTGRDRHERVAEYLDELILLADTAGADISHTITQERERVNPATFIGKGKAEEIANLVGAENITLVIFDDDLSPVQVRNLEKVINCKIIDRSGLILDIFAARAKTKEAMTQVELAQLQYLLPRLTRQWTHLSKQFGGIGTKGPGEQQIEVDRRSIRTRISHLKEKLAGISREREVQRKGRKELTRVALVGYTNAGKSTLLRLLTGADVLIEDRLFATLDTTVRQVELAPKKKILLSDTVGFIRKLPPHLIASFKSTLAEVVEADVILHVVDVSHSHFAEHLEVVNATLGELDAGGKPTIYVFNKIDRMKDRSLFPELAERFKPAVFISASRAINISGLTGKLLEYVDQEMAECTLRIAQSDSGLIAKLHSFAEIIDKSYDDDTVAVHFRVSHKDMDHLRKLLGKRYEVSFNKVKGNE